MVDLRFDALDDTDPPNTVYWQSGNKFRRGTISVGSESSGFYGTLKIDLRFDGFDETDRLFAACETRSTGETRAYVTGDSLEGPAISLRSHHRRSTHERH
jgi:hypothetical protein